MGAGPLRKRVIFQREVRTDDGAGGVTVAWTPWLTVWGQYVPERGREAVEAGRLNSAMLGTLRVRSSSQSRAIDATYTVVIDDLQHQVRTISNPDQNNKYLEMTVERGVAV